MPVSAPHRDEEVAADSCSVSRLGEGKASALSWRNRPSRLALVCPKLDMSATLLLSEPRVGSGLCWGLLSSFFLLSVLMFLP